MTAPAPVSESTIEEGKRLLASATPGPWRFADWFCGTDKAATSENKQTIDGPPVPGWRSTRMVASFLEHTSGALSKRQRIANADANAALIVFAVNNLPALLRAASEAKGLREALVDHNDLLRSAFQAAQRDATHEVRGTTNYRMLADRAHEVLAKHHAVTNEARAALAQGEGR